MNIFPIGPWAPWNIGYILFTYLFPMCSLLPKRYCFVIIVQLFSHVWLFVTPWTAACQASQSFTMSQSLLKFTSTELVIPSNHFILCHPLLPLPSIFPSIQVFLMSWLFASGGQCIGASATAPVLLMNTQDWSPLGWTGCISLQSTGLSRFFSNTTVQKHRFFGAQPS